MKVFLSHARKDGELARQLAEGLIALASLDPWPTDWRPRNDEAFRELTPADLDRLLKQFGEHAPNCRSATQLAFRVLH